MVKDVRGNEVILADIMPSVESYKHQFEHVIPRNVASVYSRIPDDIIGGTRTAKNVKGAVCLHDIIDRLERREK